MSRQVDARSRRRNVEFFVVGQGAPSPLDIIHRDLEIPHRHAAKLLVVNQIEPQKQAPEHQEFADDPLSEYPAHLLFQGNPGQLVLPRHYRVNVDVYGIFSGEVGRVLHYRRTGRPLVD